MERDASADEQARSFHAFTYGTLLSEKVLRAVLGCVPARTAATLYGYRRHAIRHCCYPAVIASSSAHASVSGKLLTLTRRQLCVLDSFEHAAYQRLTLRVLDEHERWMEARVWARADGDDADLVQHGDWDYELFVRRDEQWYAHMCAQWRQQQQQQQQQQQPQQQQPPQQQPPQ
eukprot:TRINITY_DN733_c0_g1_i1.p5 TRINITY_DN733_c0_g1~~TRINITY_DN733_c0_g1_i1.p5  ORF type:complete len:174 (-),score=56.14 TRINITY_DN733_c0_g1_i1:1-522(-)